jgi:hypothetical protein
MSKTVLDIVWCARAELRTRRDWIQPAITFDIVAPFSAPSSLGAAHRPPLEPGRGFGR